MTAHPFEMMKSGHMWVPEACGTVRTSMTPTVNTVYYVPLWRPDSPVEFDAAYFDVAGTAGAGGVARVGLYGADPSTHLPKARRWEAPSTVDTTTTGRKKVTLPDNVVVGSELIYLALVFQVAAPAALYGYSASLGDPRITFPEATTGRYERTVHQNSVTGALPATATAILGAVGVPGLELRIA